MPVKLAIRTLACALTASLALLMGGCATAPETADEPEPLYVPPEAVTPAGEAESATQPAEPEAPEAAEEPVVPPTPEPQTPPTPATPPEPAAKPKPAPRPGAKQDSFDDVVVKAKPRDRHEVIRDLVAEAKALLRDVELKYVFTGKGKREALRGRPVAFALWSEAAQRWTIAHLEIPRPPIRSKPGRPMQVRVLTPGVTARHVKGTGAERLMFAFTKGTDTLKVYGRKFPVFDNALIKKKRWRTAVANARPIVYLPFTEDTLDPLFVRNGREFLLSTARKAIDELRAADTPSVAFPGEPLANVVPPELITTLAVIEQTDDADYVRKQTGAFEEVLSQYGLKREEAFRYSVSSAGAIGAMQFTDRRGRGTYSMVVRRCRSARLDSVFERGATDLLNSMKAAICLFDIELAQMPPEIRRAYWDNKRVLGIFPVAAYNGGPRNVARLHRVIRSMGLALEDLRPPGEVSDDDDVSCPCLWTTDGDGVRPVSLPRYNNENRWYVQKYQTVVSLFEDDGAAAASAAAKQ